jgi:hypothetical protein
MRRKLFLQVDSRCPTWACPIPNWLREEVLEFPARASQSSVQDLRSSQSRTKLRECDNFPGARRSSPSLWLLREDETGF